MCRPSHSFLLILEIHFFTHKLKFARKSLRTSGSNAAEANMILAPSFPYLRLTVLQVLLNDGVTVLGVHHRKDPHVPKL